MIVRTWTGWTENDKAAEYESYMREEALPGYASVVGNLGVLMTKRSVAGERTEFLMISLWDSWDSIRAFAGEDVSRAVFYPRDDDLLADRQLEAQHYEVYGSTPGLGG